MRKVLVAAILAATVTAGIATANAMVAIPLSIQESPIELQSVEPQELAQPQELMGPVNAELTTSVPTTPAIEALQAYPAEALKWLTPEEIKAVLAPEALASLQSIHMGCLENPPRVSPPEHRGDPYPNGVHIVYDCTEYMAALGIRTGVMVERLNCYGSGCLGGYSGE